MGADILAESILTPVEVHAEPTVISWVAMAMDTSRYADPCGTENDRMIRAHPSSPIYLSSISPSSLEIFSSKLASPLVT
jgi:hypothetical protein